jgi:hypothetical protein
MKKHLGQNRGFIRIIILIIVILVIGSFFGLNFDSFWNNILAPIVAFVWGLVVVIANFLSALLRAGIAGFDNISNLFN